MDRRVGGQPSEGRINTAPRRASAPARVSPFVGRDGELRRLTEALDLAAEGQGGIVFLTGQHGIGKTRLAREVLAIARGRGFTVLEGRAYPLEVGLAYAPIVDAFGSLLRSLDAERIDGLIGDLPDLGRLFSGLRLPAPVPPHENLGDASFEKTRLFESVLRLLERLMQGAPVAFFLDDVHLADAATLELLHYLGRGLFGQRTLLLATYGDDSLDASRSLRTLVGSLQRDWLAQEIVLASLSPEAVDKLVRGSLAGEAPEDLLRVLNARAGGTPLFVEALIDVLIDSGSLVRQDRGWVYNSDAAMALPPSVRRLILDRVEWLKPVDRQVLDLIAIMGDATSHTLLRVAGGLDEEALLRALHRLEAARLVVEEIKGLEVVYSVIHPLVGEVANAELPEMARRRIHLKAIEALDSPSERRPGGLSSVPEEILSRLARHYRGAGSEADPDRALEVLLAAGERARTLYANDDAARHYVAALAMLRTGQSSATLTVGPGFPTAGILPWLLERLGEVWERTGQGGAAVGVWEEALALHESAGDPVSATRLRVRLAFAEWDRGHFDVAKAYLDAGLVALAHRSEDEAGQELADLHFARFHILHRSGAFADAAAAAAELLSIAALLASPRIEAEAHLVMTALSMGQGDVVRAREHALHALSVAETQLEGQGSAICCRAHDALAVIGMRVGDHRSTRHHAEQGLAVAQRLGAPSFDVLLRSRLAYANFMAGSWEESLRNNAEAMTLARRVGYSRGQAHSLASRAMILALQGDLPSAANCISEARSSFGNGQPDDRLVYGLMDIVRATLSLEKGEVDRALEIARVFAGSSKSTAASSGLTTSNVPAGLMVLAEAQAAAGDGEGALETARELASLGPADAPFLKALTSRAEGLAHSTMGQRAAAIACLIQAYAIFSELEIPFESARCLLEKAEIEGRGKEPNAWKTGNAPLLLGPPSLSCARAVRQSLAVFERLGARRYARRARRLLHRLGTSQPPVRPHRSGGDPLSKRELEVARLVAKGLTTAQVAETLVLSPLTVNSHIHHMYTRLSISSRAALARYVIEAGMLSPAPENT